MLQFSIIIPTFNRSALLAKAIDSALAQEISDYEILVVDDGSTDTTPDLLKSYASAHEGKVRIFSQLNGGPGAARNLALAAARGEYCVFLDSDDLLFPWSLATLSHVIAENKRPTLVVIETNVFVEAPTARLGPTRLRVWPDYYRYLLANGMKSAGTIVVRREAVQKVGEFLADPMVGEDADLMLRLGMTRDVVKIEAPPLLAYRAHTENFTGKSERWYRGAVFLMRRYRQRVYPGHDTRGPEIRALLAKALVFFGQACLYLGDRRAYAKLYVKTLGFQLQSGNYKYAVHVPMMLVRHLLGMWPRGSILDAVAAANRAEIAHNAALDADSAA